MRSVQVVEGVNPVGSSYRQIHQITIAQPLAYTSVALKSGRAEVDHLPAKTFIFLAVPVDCGTTD